MTTRERAEETLKRWATRVSVWPVDAIELLEQALIEERKAAIKEEREACHSIAYDEAMEWGVDLNGRTAGISIAGKIRARSS